MWPVVTATVAMHPPPPSAVIEHTNKVIFLEDDDVAAVKKNGSKLILYLPSYSLSLFYCSPFYSSHP